jgi:hypothetical protein
VYKCNVIPFVSIQRLLLRSLLRFHGVTMSDDSLSAELFHINYVENLAAMSSLVDLRNFLWPAIGCSLFNGEFKMSVTILRLVYDSESERSVTSG